MSITRRQFLFSISTGAVASALPSLCTHAPSANTDAIVQPYVDDLQYGEVELAVIRLASVHNDVISIYAKREGTMIKYSVIGGYEDDGLIYQLPFDQTEEPINITGLIKLIDETEYPGDTPGGLVVSKWETEFSWGSGDVDEALNFVTIDSSYYPELSAYYEEVAEEWISEHTEEDEEWEDA